MSKYINTYYEKDEFLNDVIKEEHQTNEFEFPEDAFTDIFEIWKQDFSLGCETWRLVARSKTYKGI